MSLKEILRQRILAAPFMMDIRASVGLLRKHGVVRVRSARRNLVTAAILCRKHGDKEMDPTATSACKTTQVPSRQTYSKGL